MSSMSSLLDSIAPKICYRCQREGHWWCQAGPLHWPICLYCAHPYHPAATEQCTESLPLVTIGRYTDPLLRHAIYAWKYGGFWAVSGDWARYLAGMISQHVPTYDYLVPIPIHWTRWLVRGFNQSTVLARQLEASIHRPTQDIVRKITRTPPQAKRPLSLRTENVRDSFCVTRLGENTRVLIVDDVVTTGATLLAVRKVLEAAHWHVVGAVAIADARR